MKTRAIAVLIVIVFLATIAFGVLAVGTTGQALEREQEQSTEMGQQIADLTNGYKELALAAIEAQRPKAPWWSWCIVIIGLSVAGFLAWREVQKAKERQAELAIRLLALQAQIQQSQTYPAALPPGQLLEVGARPLPAPLPQERFLERRDRTLD